MDFHTGLNIKMKSLSLLTLALCTLSACAPKFDLEEKNTQNAEHQIDTVQNVTGTWSWSGENESGGYLKTIQTENKVQFQLEIMRGAPSYNHGLIDGEFNLDGNVGIFQTNEYGSCEIFFDFQKTKAVLTQPPEKTDCGFGYGVYPDGTYILNSPQGRNN